MLARFVGAFLVLVIAFMNTVIAQVPSTSIAQLLCKGGKPWGVAVLMPEKGGGIFQFAPDFCVNKPDNVPPGLDTQSGPKPTQPPLEGPKPKPKQVDTSKWLTIKQ